MSCSCLEYLNVNDRFFPFSLPFFVLCYFQSHESLALKIVSSYFGVKVLKQIFLIAQNDRNGHITTSIFHFYAVIWNIS